MSSAPKIPRDAGRLLTREDFLARQKALYRGQWWRAAAYLGPLLAIGLAPNILLGMMRRGVIPVPPGDARLALGLALLAAMAAMGALIALRRRHDAALVRRHGLACVACGQALVGRDNAAVVTTGRCGRCGAAVLADVADSAAETSGVGAHEARRRWRGLATRQELAARQAAHRRRAKRDEGVLTVAVLAAILGPLAVPGFFRLPGAAWIVVVMAIGGTIGLAVVTTRRARTLVRQASLECGHCGGALLDVAGQLAVATGRCGACGGQVAVPERAPR